MFRIHFNIILFGMASAYQLVCSSLVPKWCPPSVLLHSLRYPSSVAPSYIEWQFYNILRRSSDIPAFALRVWGKTKLCGLGPRANYTDRSCGLAVRLPGYRSRGSGPIPGATRFIEK
jgi:hypothetical protein